MGRSIVIEVRGDLAILEPFVALIVRIGVILS